MQVTEKKVSTSKELESLLKETHEVLVQNFEKELQNGERKQFSVVDLWKMEKVMKSSHLHKKWLN